MSSRYACEVCGLSVRLFRGTWKHSGGGAATGCGRPARVVERSAYEAELAAVVRELRKR